MRCSKPCLAMASEQCPSTLILCSTKAGFIRLLCCQQRQKAVFCNPIFLSQLTWRPFDTLTPLAMLRNPGH